MRPNTVKCRMRSKSLLGNRKEYTHEDINNIIYGDLLYVVI